MPIVKKPCEHCGGLIPPFSPSLKRRYCGQECARAAISAPAVADGLKWCSGCRGAKPATPEHFNRRARSRDGLHGWCKSCMNGRERPRAWHQTERGREHMRNARLRSRYGITLEDYEAMLAAQDGRCAICRQPPKKNRLHVDHDHMTGEVRGLLCGPCNRGLSYFERANERRS